MNKFSARITLPDVVFLLLLVGSLVAVVALAVLSRDVPPMLSFVIGLSGARLVLWHDRS